MLVRWLSDDNIKNGPEALASGPSDFIFAWGEDYIMS